MAKKTKEEFREMVMKEFAIYAEDSTREHVHLSEFLFDKLYEKYQSSVRMAGDLGKLISKVGDLERQIELK